MHKKLGRYCELHGKQELSVDKPGLDLRLPEYRRDVFKKFYRFMLKYRCLPGMVYVAFPYIIEKYNLDKEQQLWLAFLNGNTQNIITSFILFEKFPDIHNIDLTELKKFFDENWDKLSWDTDRKYQKAKFLKSVENYIRLFSQHGTQEKMFSNICCSDNKFENFDLLWAFIRKEYFEFGRLSTFSYTEYLFIIGLNINCSTLFLDDKSGSKSHRNGLCRVLGRDDLDWHNKLNPEFDGKYSKETIEWLGKEAEILLEEMKDVVEEKDKHLISYFTLESCFCTFKSHFRMNRRYASVYSDMFYERIKRAEKFWVNECPSDLNIFWDMRKELLPKQILLEMNSKDVGVKPIKQNQFLLTGQICSMMFEYAEFESHYDMNYITGDKINSLDDWF